MSVLSYMEDISRPMASTEFFFLTSFQIAWLLLINHLNGWYYLS